MKISFSFKKVVLFVIISLFLSTSYAFAQDAGTTDFEEKEVTIIGEDQVINKDFFASGEVVEMSGTVNGDVYAAGGQVIINGTINGDVLAAGGTVTISGDITQDVRVAGGQVVISGTVGRNVSVAGGNVSFGKESTVNGNVVGGAGNMDISGPVGGDLMIGAGNLVIADVVTGDADVATGNLQLTSNASIQGNLTYVSDQPASFSTEQVVGEITQKQTPTRPETPDIDTAEIESFFAGFATFIEIVGFVSTLIVGLLFIHLYPRFSKNTTETLNKLPWKALGVGFVVLILAPVIVVALMITIIGIPLGLILAVAYGISLYLANIVAALYVGQFAVAKTKQKINDGWAFVIGLLLLSIIGIIPLFGWLVAFFALLMGLGSLVVTKMELYNTLKKKKLL